MADVSKNITKYENKETVQKLIHLGLGFCIVGTAVPLLVLLLRIVDYNFLIKIVPGNYLMNPLTSICFALLGFSIWLVRTEQTMEKYLLIARIICITVLLYCLSVLILYHILHLKYEPDLFVTTLLLKNPENYGLHLNYDSMVINNAIGSILLAISIIFINHKNTKLYYSPEALNYITIWGTFLIIYGYIYSLEDLYASFGRIPMSFYSAVTLLLLSYSVLLLRPYKGTMSYLIGESPADVFMMRFLAFLIPLIIGYLKIQGEKYNLYNEEIGTAIFAIITFIITMSLLGWKSNIQFKLQTAQQQKFNIIKKDRKKLESILNGSPTYIQILDIEKDLILFSNEGGEGSFTLGKEIENRKYSEIIKKIIHPNDLNIYIESIQRVSKLKDNEYDDIEFRVIDRQNNSIWLISRASVYKRKNGKVTQIISNAIDITEEKQKEKELLKEKINLENSKSDLENAEQKLKEANKKLEEEVKKHAAEIFKSEKKYHDYIRNSFAGIVEHEHIKGGIDIHLPVKEQIKLIKEYTIIKEVNPTAASIHGYTNPKDLENIKVIDYMKLPEEQFDALIKEFVENNYKVIGKEPVEFTKEGKPVKVYINAFGIIKNNKLVKTWEVQTQSQAL